MKTMKKVLALVLAMAMVLAMSVTAFASGGLPTSDDRGSVTINGISKGDSVSIYKIVKANYNNEGFTGYEAVVADSIANLTAPTTAEIAALATNNALQPSGSSTSTGESITFDGLQIGMYLVKITAVDPLTVYNPMVVSVHYSPADNDQILSGVVSADDDWVINGSTAYAKSSTDNIPDKNIVDGNGEIIVNGESAGKGDAVAKDDTVNYKISGTVPSYSKEYFTNPVYELRDTLSSGLDFSADTQTKVQQQIDAKYAGVEGNATVKVEGRTLTIVFSKELIWNIANNEDLRDYEFTYSAVLNGTSVNFNPSTNGIVVNYSRTPSEVDDADPVTTYSYTFAFNGEVKKVDDEGNALQGAKFGLFEEAGCTTKLVEVLSGPTGEFAFTGLDDGTYYLKETVAPDEYQLNNTVYEIIITPTYNADGTLKEYTFSVRDINEEAAVVTKYEKNTAGEVVVVGDKIVTEIQNTKLSSLPSTGGIGTTIFTIGGCVIMIVAAGMYFASRRKEEN